MACIDDTTPAKAFTLGVLLAGVNPKNLFLTVAAAASLAQLGLSTAAVIGSLAVFVLVANLTVVGPVLAYLIGGDRAKAGLDQLEG